jgi:hypothetical protein
LIRSMRNRCLQVIRSQGGHTSYWCYALPLSLLL